MSKSFVRGGPAEAALPFSTLLPKLAVRSEPTARAGKLGKTAEGLHRLQEEARAAGRAEGYEQGLVEGREAGMRAVEDQMQASVAEFRAALQEAAGRIESGMAEWTEKAEQNLAELAVAIAAKILGREIQLEQDVITDLVCDAVREVTTADKIRIRVNPFDSPILAKERSRILSANSGLRNVEIVEDPEIEGGARIESDSGVIDATIRTQLELAIRAIRGKA